MLPPGPPVPARLPARVERESVRLPALRIAPPLPPALPGNAIALASEAPGFPVAALFPVSVESTIVIVPELKIAPPPPAAPLWARVPAGIALVPPPPPGPAELALRVELAIVIVPLLAIAPPLPPAPPLPGGMKLPKPDVLPPLPPRPASFPLSVTALSTSGPAEL